MSRLHRLYKRRLADVNIVDEPHDDEIELSQPNEMPAGEQMQDNSVMHPEDTQKNASSKHSAMLAIYPTKKAASQIAAKYSDIDVDSSYLHITLVYLGKGLSDDTIDLVKEAASEVCSAHLDIRCRMQGLGLFDHEDAEEGGRPFYASVDGRGMAALRVDLVRALEKLGVKVPSEYDFTPHMTLAYMAPELVEIEDGSPGIEWTSDQLELVIGNEHIESFILGADHEKQAAGFSTPTTDGMKSLHNLGENTQEDPDLKLGEVETPYSDAYGPLGTRFDDSGNVLKGAEEIVAVALPDNSTNENVRGSDPLISDQSIPIGR